MDAGTFGTMGVGIPFALAAKAYAKHKLVVAILGDSAFGFSAMEIGTIDIMQTLVSGTTCPFSSSSSIITESTREWKNSPNYLKKFQ